mmetsp:Transcript_119832/g.382527  ORF Transcript_119832/g.382527 Transcript_119832/m.382527 type:complete len:218 (-) Transcript_119832:851-1504(-)
MHVHKSVRLLPRWFPASLGTRFEASVHERFHRRALLPSLPCSIHAFGPQGSGQIARSRECLRRRSTVDDQRAKLMSRVQIRSTRQIALHSHRALGADNIRPRRLHRCGQAEADEKASVLMDQHRREGGAPVDDEQVDTDGCLAWTQQCAWQKRGGIVDHPRAGADNGCKPRLLLLWQEVLQQLARHAAAHEKIQSWITSRDLVPVCCQPTSRIANHR